MEKIKAFHILNHGEKKGALKIAKLIRTTSALVINYGLFGKGAYAHYFKNINKKIFKNEPMVIFKIDSKKITNKECKPYNLILIEGDQEEDMAPIEILEFRNVRGIK
jgi:hypothetical protein